MLTLYDGVHRDKVENKPGGRFSSWNYSVSSQRFSVTVVSCQTQGGATVQHNVRLQTELPHKTCLQV